MSAHEIIAPPHWQHIDFISDLHLQEGDRANISAWKHWAETTQAQAAFILGDLFEIWVGDDVLDAPGFEREAAQVLKRLSERCALFFVHGNRDFLIGERMLQSCGMQALADPSVFIFNGIRYALSHGDALCLGDTEYQKFRRQVRSTEWQTAFLSKPLAERQQIAKHMREVSAAKQEAQSAWTDVDAKAVQDVLNQVQAKHMIHGHTHEGRDHAVHSTQGTGIRHALSDWELLALNPRGFSLQLVLENGQISLRRQLAHVPMA